MNAKHIKQALKDAQVPWGTGWTSLTPSMRNAAVCAALMGQFTAIDSEYLSAERKAELFTKWQDIFAEAGRTEF